MNFCKQCGARLTANGCPDCVRPSPAGMPAQYASPSEYFLPRATGRAETLPLPRTRYTCSIIKGVLPTMGTLFVSEEGLRFEPGFLGFGERGACLELPFEMLARVQAGSMNDRLILTMRTGESHCIHFGLVNRATVELRERQIGARLGRGQ